MCPKRTMWHQSPLLILVGKPSCPTSAGDKSNHDQFYSTPEKCFLALFWILTLGGWERERWKGKKAALVRYICAAHAPPPTIWPSTTFPSLEARKRVKYFCSSQQPIRTPGSWLKLAQLEKTSIACCYSFNLKTEAHVSFKSWWRFVCSSNYFLCLSIIDYVCQFIRGQTYCYLREVLGRVDFADYGLSLPLL